MTEKESLYVAQPENSSARVASGKMSLARRARMAARGVSVTEGAAFDELLDLLLPHPDFHIVREADEGEVHLVIPHLGGTRGIDDGVDRALEHVIRAPLLAHRLARGLGGVDVLILALLANLAALALGGDELDLAGIDERALHVGGEGVHVDVLMAEIKHLAHDHGGLLVVLAREIRQPVARQPGLDPLP